MIHHPQPAIPPEPWRELLTVVRSSWPPELWSNVGVVVGCSGGADSVALVRALSDLRADNAAGFIIAAYFDHGIRGAEARQDAGFVRQLSEQLDIRHAVDRAASPACDESTMRAARIAFLRQTAQTSGARYVAVAHSVDDTVETVLHNLMRGTGPKGLAGMPKTRPLGHDSIGQDLMLIRPLLSAHRDLIRAGLRSIGQDWREDPSNQDTAYRRNWIRGELLPLMQSQFPSVIDAVARAARLQSEWKSTIEAISEEWIQQQVTFTPVVKVRCDDSTPSPVVITSLQGIWARLGWPQAEMTHDRWKRLAVTIASADVERYSLPGDIDVHSDGQAVEFHR